MNRELKKRILIVDDMPNWRDALTVVLSENYDIVSSASFEEARLAVNESVFDLAVLDICLEAENKLNVHGLELLRRIREKHPALPIIILTGYPQSIPSNVIDRYKPEGFLSKPISIETLTEQVNKLLG